MRSFVLFIVLLLCVKIFPQLQAAENERRFLGKESVAWVEVNIKSGGPENFMERGYYMEVARHYSAGDTIFDGKKYTVMHTRYYLWYPEEFPETIAELMEYESPYHYYIREDEDGCVWINLGENWVSQFICDRYWSNEWYKDDMLLYDFSGNWDDSENLTVRYGKYFPASRLYLVAEEEAKSFKQETLLNGEVVPMVNYIIYGIGDSGYGPAGLLFQDSMALDGHYNFFLSFYRDGELLFENTREREMIEKRINDVKTGISTIVPDEKTESGAMYDLSGRRIDKKSAKGLYIQNGRKYVVR